MVVAEDYAGGTNADRWREYLTGMHQACVEGSDAHCLGLYDLVPGVQKDHDKMLALEVFDVAKLWQDFRWRSDRFIKPHASVENAPGELEYGEQGDLLGARQVFAF